jgi:cysteine synthase
MLYFHNETGMLNRDSILKSLIDLFEGLDNFTIEKYNQLSKQEWSDRAWFTPIPRNFEENIQALRIDEYKRLIDKLAIGKTGIYELPEEINPYSKHGIRIYVKKEYENPGQSGKDRPASLMLWAYERLGFLNKTNKITTAGAGNFAKSVAIYSKKLAPWIEVYAYAGNLAVKRNPEIFDELKRLGVKIEEVEDGQCPHVPIIGGNTGTYRGMAITQAFLQEGFLPEQIKEFKEYGIEVSDIFYRKKNIAIFLDQHSYWKPFDGILSASSYYHTLGEELVDFIKNLTNGESVNTYFVHGLGTRSSFLGTSVRLLRELANVEVIAQIPKAPNGSNSLRIFQGAPTPTFQFGLRRLSELGDGHILSYAHHVANELYEISDKEVAKMFVKLIEQGIPSCPSFAGNVVASLNLAKILHEKGKEAIITTIAFDTPEHYRTFLEINLPELIREPFSRYERAFEDVVGLSRKEREEAMSKRSE